MELARLRYWDQFYALQDGVWTQVSPEDVVTMFNSIVERYKVVLDDIEEIVRGHNS